MRVELRVAVVLVVGILAGCGGTKGAGAVALGTDVTLAPGQSIRLARDGVKIKFVGVTGDSRCPRGVSCVWEGDATVTLSDAGKTSYQLHTNAGAVRMVMISGHEVRLVRLSPQPRAGSPIQQRDYRATLRID
ncbi:MAG: hypothetical protein ABIS86_05705 [Streptosporangiaceae bacterium]